jgi:hypothetical protein
VLIVLVELSDPDDSIDMTELIGNTEGFAESG